MHSNIVQQCTLETTQLSCHTSMNLFGKPFLTQTGLFVTSSNLLYIQRYACIQILYIRNHPIVLPHKYEFVWKAIFNPNRFICHIFQFSLYSKVCAKRKSDFILTIFNLFQQRGSISATISFAR